MKRVLSMVAVAVVVALVVIVATGGQSGYRVAAIFDTANGIIPGNQVKIAGVAVGSVAQVDLAPGPRARIVMTVARRSGPFYRDATCTILPEGLISENFVECSPGASDSGPLADVTRGVPTVPVTRTTVPASLQQVLDVFSLPTDDRVRVMLDELGIGTAGRGTDLNAVLRQSNPALGQAERVLSIIDAQRDELVTGIEQTNRVLSSVASRTGSLRSFVDHATTVADTFARHQASVGAAVHRLPGLLDAVRPGLGALDRAVRQSLPLLHNVRSAAPALTSATREIPTFADAAIPALPALGSAAKAGQSAVRAAGPIVVDLRHASATAVPFATSLDQLLVSSRDAGALEGLLRFFYSLAAISGGYDQLSHMWVAAVQVFPQCLLPGGAPGCSSTYTAPGDGTIPVDDPACGPQQGATWDPPTDCQSLLSGLRKTSGRTQSTTPRASTEPGRHESQSSPRVTKPVAAPAQQSSPASTTPAAAPGAITSGSTTSQPTSEPPSSTGPLQQLLGFLFGR